MVAGGRPGQEGNLRVYDINAMPKETKNGVAILDGVGDPKVMLKELVDTDDATLFGDTELKLRDITLLIAARAYQLHLRDKKTATTGPACPAPAAASPPATTATAAARR